MVPFCNRVEGNRFSFEGEEYQLERNTDWDPLYLHGEGWISTWRVMEQTGSSITMGLSHSSEKGAPYGYDAVQNLSVDKGVLSITVTLTNRLDRPLPFGTGHHLFFPKTPGMTLQAKAEGYWTEKESFLPDRRTAVAGEMDFSSPSGIPGHWINNGFDNWDGRAEILWPERNLGVRISGDGYFRDYFVFHSDKDFEPDFKDDYFCFEPMTHTANGHNRPPDYGGLVSLKKDESLRTELRIQPFEWPGA
jgi:aldose 1-epimerase